MCSKMFCRKFGTKIRPKIVLNETVVDDINKEICKPRHHPGIMKPKSVTLPDAFVKAVRNITQDYPIKTLAFESQKLATHLKGKVPPMEQEEIKETVESVRDKVLNKHKHFIINSEQDEIRFKQMIKNKTDNILREKIYNWKPMKYDVHTSLLYLLGRSAADYAVLVKIFSEIHKRDSEFIPRSLFDFGSGVGSVSWAANAYWNKQIYEYFNVDASGDMNDLAQSLLNGGRGNQTMPMKGVFYRQFLPASNRSYDLVVSAYSLLELPSLQTRLQTILNLWNKTHKYLVIVEQGTNAGFKVVNEARDFILQIEHKKSRGHVFSPCPHDEVCPRFLLDDGTPCNFEMTYHSIPVGDRSELRKELYSYVVLRKGERSSDDPQWPRIVRPALVRSKHTICRMCAASGKLDEVIFTAAKHGKTTYHCARSTKWGDLLPVTIKHMDEKKEESEQNTIE